MNVSLPEQWLEKATDDLAVARLTQEAGYTDFACFHSQQCIEKSLKAFLIAKTNSYPFIHALPDLLKLCNDVDPSFASFLPDVRVVDQYYIATRYPSGIPGGSIAGPTSVEAEEAIAIAKKVLQFVRSSLTV